MIQNWKHDLWFLLLLLVVGCWLSIGEGGRKALSSDRVGDEKEEKRRAQQHRRAAAAETKEARKKRRSPDGEADKRSVSSNDTKLKFNDSFTENGRK